MCEELEKLKTREANAVLAMDRAQRKLDGFNSGASVGMDESKRFKALRELRESAERAKLMMERAQSDVEKHRLTHGC